MGDSAGSLRKKKVGWQLLAAAVGSGSAGSGKAGLKQVGPLSDSSRQHLLAPPSTPPT